MLKISLTISGASPSDGSSRSRGEDVAAFGHVDQPSSGAAFRTELVDRDAIERNGAAESLERSHRAKRRGLPRAVGAEQFRMVPPLAAGPRVRRGGL